MFFRESFRRVEPRQIGKTIDMYDSEDMYAENFIKTIDTDIFNYKTTKVVADAMFGSVSDVYPRILNALGIDNVIINAYKDDKRLSSISMHVEKSQKELMSIMQSLNSDIGFMIFPSGRKLKILCDSGISIRYNTVLISFLYLINLYKEEKKVFLSFAAPDFCDDMFENIKLSRGKIRDLTIDEMKDYYLISNTIGNYAFTEFSYSMDALYASVKMIKMLKEQDLRLSDVVKKIPQFYYKVKK